ncbi:7203_t:CDS:2 [Gigaspora margarita]|uniref:7203_t:CDS:1 n=1 Tax=Gigaspora margarita TaxID=4874 RepID=A0ABN7VEF3_GIGMA|nr:7203_t:CDS:2 [Gigaspora margarita]
MSDHNYNTIHGSDHNDHDTIHHSDHSTIHNSDHGTIHDSDHGTIHDSDYDTIYNHDTIEEDSLNSDRNLPNDGPNSRTKKMRTINSKFQLSLRNNTKLNLPLHINRQRKP